MSQNRRKSQIYTYKKIDFCHYSFCVHAKIIFEALAFLLYYEVGEKYINL